MPHLVDHKGHRQSDSTIFQPASVRTVNRNDLILQAIIFSDHHFNINSNNHIVEFLVLTLQQIEQINPMSPGDLKNIMIVEHDNNGP